MMFKVYIWMHCKKRWVPYSNCAYACELDALDEYTKARLEGYAARIMEV